MYNIVVSRVECGRLLWRTPVIGSGISPVSGKTMIYDLGSFDNDRHVDPDVL